MKIRLSHIPGLLMIMVLLLGMSACKSAKTASEDSAKPKNWKATVKKCEQQTVDFKSMTISGKVHADLPSRDFNMSVSYKISILADSLIWVRVSKLGFEAGRVLITRDSIRIIDRTNKTYQVSDFSPAKEYTGLDADFDMLQDLILGNFYKVPERLEVVNKKSNPLVVKGTQSETSFSYRINTDNFRLAGIEAFSESRNQHSIINYNEYNQVDRQLITVAGIIKVLLPEKLTFDFSHSRIKLDPEKISFKFSVPSGYERIP